MEAKKIMKNELFKRFLFTAWWTACLAILIVGIYVLLILRMDVEQVKIAAIICFFDFSIVCLSYIYIVKRLTSPFIKNLEEIISKKILDASNILFVSELMYIPLKLAVLTFICWMAGDIVAVIIMFFTKRFSPNQLAITFFAGASGGFIGPLISYYLYKGIISEWIDKISEFCTKDIMEEIISRMPRISILFKIFTPFIFISIIVFSLGLYTATKTGRDILLDALEKVGAIEMERLKDDTLNKKTAGSYFTVKKGEDITKNNFSSKVNKFFTSGKKHFVDFKTMNVVVFEEKDENTIHGYIYPWREFAPKQGGYLVLTLIIFLLSTGIIIFVSYFIIKDITVPIEAAEKKIISISKGDFSFRRIHPSDDKLNDLIDGILKMEGTISSTIKEAKALAVQVERLSENTRDVLYELKERLDGSLAFTGEMKSSVEKFFNFFSTGGSNIKTLSLSAEEVSSSAREMEASLKETNNSMETPYKNIEVIPTKLSQFLLLSTDFLTFLKTLSEFTSRGSIYATDGKGSYESVELQIKETRKLIGSENKMAKDGSNAIVDVKKGIEEASIMMDELNERIQKLHNDISKIGGILNLINDITEETNLLALNASIIAAQAGEKGQSFAVVAEEIKELADRTQMSTKEISNIINTIRDETERSVDNVKNVREKIASELSKAQLAEESLALMYKTAGQADEEMLKISLIIEEQKEMIEEVIESTKYISENTVRLSNAFNIQKKEIENTNSAIKNINLILNNFLKTLRENTNTSKMIVENIERISEMITFLSKSINDNGGEAGKLREKILSGEREFKDNVSSIEKLIENLSYILEETKRIKDKINKFNL